MFLTSFQLRVGFVFGIVSFFFLQTKVALGFSKMGQTKKELPNFTAQQPE